jgi:hypothetical protein
MKSIINRLRRLENAAAPAEWGRAAADEILEARRQRLGEDYVEPAPFPPGSFDGCHTMADQIVRARVLSMERQSLIKRVGHEDDWPPTAEA